MNKNNREMVMLAGFAVVAFLLISNYQAIFASNVVTITSSSPTIEINGVQYKYEQVPVKLVTTGSLYDTSRRKVCSFENTIPVSNELIARFAGHEIVLNYDYYQKPIVSETIDCPAQPGNYVGYFGSGVKMITATLDGQTKKVSGSLYRSVLAGGIRGTTAADFIATTPVPQPEILWVQIGDSLFKFQIEYTNTDNPISQSVQVGSNYYKQFAYNKIKISAWAYIPSKYFKQAFCGDSNCDLSETCQTCAQDCGTCPPVPNCGDGKCSNLESCALCPADCKTNCDPYCGDAVCNGDETCATCTQDCGSCIEFYCGDSKCNGDETCATCTQDCGYCPAICGDELCQNEETPLSCPADCGLPATLCGNDACDAGEDCRCQDCSCPFDMICSPGASGADQRGCVSGSTYTPPEVEEEEPCTPGVDCEIIDEPEDVLQQETAGIPNWQLILAIVLLLIIWQRKRVRAWLHI